MTQSDDTSPENSAENSAGAQAAAGTTPSEAPAKKTAARKTAAKKATARKTTPRKTAKASAAADPEAAAGAGDADTATSGTPAKKTAARRTTKKAAAPETGSEAEADAGTDPGASGAPMVLFQAPETTTAPRRRTRKAAEAPPPADDAAAQAEDTAAQAESADEQPRKRTTRKSAQKSAQKSVQKAAEKPTEKATEPATEPAGDETGKKPAKKAASKSSRTSPEKEPDKDGGAEQGGTEQARSAQDGGESQDSTGGDAGPDSGSDSEGGRRRRRRGGRRRRKSSDDSGNGSDNGDNGGNNNGDNGSDEDADGDEGGSRRRRTRNRQPKSPEDEITSVSGSTRLEAKKQRRREGREAGRRRAPIVSEAEFLARRESVDRVMVIRQKDDLTQIGVLEDKVLVEHYVARESQTSLIGNIYLGRVQNVLPSMEAAFVDIGKGRNAVLYAGEVNWKALGHKDGQPRKIESVLSSGQTVLVQVTKDPIGHKGARLTGQISLPGRFLVYVPDGTTSGISRKLPDTERSRLKALLKEIVPDSAGVIVRTAAEGASEEELTRDVERLTARWADIDKKVQSGKGPELLYGEPDLTLKVVRDLFTEDFAKLVVQGDDAWDLVDGYVSHVAPDLRDRLERFEVATEGSDEGKDLFAAYRVDEQIAKGLDRKVWLPSGGSLIIDRTEAMTVVDVNTGKFTGSGGNLEETVTKNNLEAAEEIVRQLRLRDIGGIIVVDFIDMVLESNRDLVLRRLVECLGRDRTRHQVAEVTSLGLVQMTRKRIGTGLLEAFGEECQHCKGRGVLVHDHPIEPSQKAADDTRGRRGRGGRARGKGGDQSAPSTPPVKPSPKDLAGTKPPTEREQDGDEQPEAPATPSPKNQDLAQEAASGKSAPETTPETAPETGAETDAGSTPSSPSDQQDSPQQASTEQASTEQASTEQAGAPVAVEQPAPVDTAPRVVTTRRRRAARPAGPPVTAETSAGTPSQQQGGEVDASDEPRSDQPRSDEPQTGVAQSDQLQSDAAENDAAEDGTRDGVEDGPALRHVPIKKKGSRKR